jgi:hypothetical protein
LLPFAGHVNSLGRIAAKVDVDISLMQHGGQRFVRRLKQLHTGNTNTIAHVLSQLAGPASSCAE